MTHTFQSIIIQLQEFWASRGCLIWQPYYTQVGAGTMNPATFLRVLGPEPWNVAYVEPSVRPDDGRYGENPNRLQMHYQYQVILKPDTGNPQEMYLDSLKAIGIDPRQHDIRFVEDNWEQPAISAWGLGWEVWLDGQEITQFTYFQQVGGVALNPVAVEITYGLDRILIALNNASGIWNEPWNEQISYGEIRRREEFEHSKYYYEVADVARARQMYDLYLAECEACLAQGLVLPAHDYVLKSSHTFNILDARGAVSLTERQASFSKMRDLARRVALAYLEQRKELGYPLLRNAEVRMQNAESGMRNAEFGMQNAEVRMQNAEVRMQNAEVRMQNAEFGMRNAESGMQNAEGRMQNAEFGMRNAESGMQNAEVRMQNAEGRMQNAEVKTKNSSFIIHHSAFVLEIGTEELPAADVDAALAQLREKVPAWLEELRLEHGAVMVHGTPRRLAVFIENLAPRQPDREDLVKGPPADKAIVGQVSDLSLPAVLGQVKDLSYTPAAQGFARKNGIRVEDLQIREMDGGKYVTAVVKSPGRPTPEVLAEALPKWVAGISFVKTMRWNESGVAFSRPIRWLVALLGATVIPFEYAGVQSDNISRGLRPYGSPQIVIDSADSYFSTLRDANIILDQEERKASIVEQVKAAAESVGGEALIEPGLLSEVANLIEKPTAVSGKFNPEFLELPRDVLIGTMKKHQRYFPVQKGAGAAVSGIRPDLTPDTQKQDPSLLPYFIAIRNGDSEHLEIVREGNEHVLGARFADASFFVREDVKFPLEHYREGLKTLTFQTKLGSMYDKSERMLQLADTIAEMLNLDDLQRSLVQRSTFLAKADLTTQMVTEMTSLQGIIGREYALRSGEAAEVAAALGEQYQPVPQTLIGVVVALADRIDSLAGLFAAGLAPTGAKDPFGLRRAAIGTVQPLIEHHLEFDLRAAIEAAAALQPIPVSDQVKAQVLEFLTGRMRVLLTETGLRYDVVEAVLAAQSHNPAASARAAQELMNWVSRPDWAPILNGYARCVRIVRSEKALGIRAAVDAAKLLEPAEKSLYENLQTLNVKPATVHELLTIVEKLIPAITEFFDNVLVMDKDETIKQNRLSLVRQVSDLSAGIADLSKLEGF